MVTLHTCGVQQRHEQVCDRGHMFVGIVRVTWEDSDKPVHEASSVFGVPVHELGRRFQRCSTVADADRQVGLPCTYATSYVPHFVYDGSKHQNCISPRLTLQGAENRLDSSMALTEQMTDISNARATRFAENRGHGVRI